MIKFFTITDAKNRPVNTFVEHKEWVLNVHMPLGDPSKIVSGSIAGKISHQDIITSNLMTVYKHFVPKKFLYDCGVICPKC